MLHHKRSGLELTDRTNSRLTDCFYQFALEIDLQAVTPFVGYKPSRIALEQVVQNTKQDVTAMGTNTNQAPLFPKPTGNYAVGTTSLYFKDSEREEPFTEDPNDLLMTISLLFSIAI